MAMPSADYVVVLQSIHPWVIPWLAMLLIGISQLVHDCTDRHAGLPQLAHLLHAAEAPGPKQAAEDSHEQGVAKSKPDAPAPAPSAFASASLYRADSR